MNVTTHRRECFPERIMKKTILIFCAILLVSASANSLACVGRTLVIGSLNTPNDKLLTQLMAVIIVERTGTSVNVEYFDSQDALYEAIKKKEVNVLSENTGRAMQLLGMEPAGDADSIYSAVKKAYREQLGLVMLEPFGAPTGSAGDTLFMDVPIVGAGVLTNFPVLPRVLNKLAGITQIKNYPKLLASVESGDKPTQVAKDFLKMKRLI